MMMAVARLTLILLATLTLSASTVLRVDVGQLSQLATNIVGGHITNITPEKNSDNGYIYSKVTLQVSQAIPSYLAGREYQFRMVGGELNGKRLHIAGFGVCTSLPTTPHLVVGRSACRVGVGPSLNRSWAQRSRPVVQAGRRAFPGDESVVD